MATTQLPPLLTAPGLLGNESVCYPATMVTTNGIWVGENPLDFALPVFLFQNMVVIFTTRLIMLLVKPFHTTRTVCEIFCGLLWGPSGFGKIDLVRKYIFSRINMSLLETMANIGVIYFLFIVGLEMDLSIIRKHGKKSIVVAVAGMFLPFLIACSFSLFLFKLTIIRQATFILLFASCLSITALPVLTRTLGEFRLLGMEISELSKSAALINEVFGVSMVVLAISLAESPKSPYLTSYWIILSASIFVVFCLLIIRPALTWLTSRKPEEEGFSDLTTSIMIAGVMFSSIITDAIGIHPMFGAFVFGLVVPHGILSVTMVEQLEDFVTGILLPLFFVTAGLKTNIAKIGGVGSWVLLIVAIVLASAAKVAGTILAALSFNIPFSEGVALGLLMNTKGFIILLGLNYGKDQKVIDDTTYTIIMLTTVVINVVVTPTLVRIYKPAHKFVPYKRRTIQQTKGDSKLRILTCIHNLRNVPTIINLIEASNPTKRSPIWAISLHLVEQTGHGASLLVSHGNRRLADEVPPAMGRVRAQTEDIVNAFEAMERNNSGAVVVQSMTSVGAYALMHEQICDLAEEKRVSLMILPFHKQQTVDGGMETANPKFRNVNENVLGNTPCSVGILVDRGFAVSTRNNTQGSHNIAVLFFGGPDDREALSLAIRMSEHPRNTLNVIRFIPGLDAVDPEMDNNEDTREVGMLTLQIDKERDNMMDDEYIKDLKLMKLHDESFSYIEKEVNNGDETVAAIRAINNIHDLFIVGRSDGAVSSLTSGLTEWSECPELGVIGDLLASADFAATVSVLVVQQYTGMCPHEDMVGTPDSSTGRQEEQHIIRSLH